MRFEFIGEHKKGRFRRYGVENRIKIDDIQPTILKVSKNSSEFEM